MTKARIFRQIIRAITIFSYLCSALVCRFRSKAAIKRESGESPEQSRCCKFHCMLQTFTSLPLEELTSGKASATETSQKTCHALFYHCFRGKSVESNVPDKSSRHFIHQSCFKESKRNKLCQVYLKDVRSK